MRNHERHCVDPDADPVDAVVDDEDLLMDEVVDDDDAVVLLPADGMEDRRVPLTDT